MSTLELAKAFTNLLKQNDDEGAAEKYNADNIVSYEAQEGPMAVCEGKAAVKQKGDWWRANHEVHNATVEGPYGQWRPVRPPVQDGPYAQADR